MNSLDQIKNSYGNKIKAFWTMGFGPGAEGTVLTVMADRMKEVGGQYKKALNLE